MMVSVAKKCLCGMPKMLGYNYCDKCGQQFLSDDEREAGFANPVGRRL